MRVLEGSTGREDLERRIEYHYWLERGARSPPTLFLYPLVCADDPLEAISSVSERDPKFVAHVQRVDGHLHRIDFERTWGGKQVASTAFLVTRSSGNFIISEEPDLSVLEGLIGRLDPEVSTVPVNSRDLLAIASSMAQSFSGFSFDVYRLTARRPGKQTIQAFIDVTLAQLRQYVDDGFWIDRMKIRVRSGDEVVLDFAVTRAGRLEFLVGNFQLFGEKILDPLLQVGNDKLAFYSDRGRRLGASIEIRPIAINGALEAKLDAKIASKLISQIKKFPRISYAVVHSGNPMLLVHIVDERDGSGYDIAAVEERVYIVPTFDSTPSALVRARELVYKTFKEGQVEDYYARQPEPELGRILSGVA